MLLDLTDEEAAALLSLGIRAKLPGAPPVPPPARPRRPMNATLAAVRARVVDQGEAANRKDGLFVTALLRGPLIDYERHQIRAGENGVTSHRSCGVRSQPCMHSAAA